MVSDWETSTLGELAEIVMGQSPKGSECNSDGHGTPLLNGPTEFGSYHPYPTQFTTDPKRFSKKDDLLFCVRGSTTGRMNWSDKEYAIGRGLAAFRHKKGKEFQSFLKGVIDIKLPELLASATGSTFPNVSKNQLNDLEVILPPLPEQKAIAHILGSLDDKIELNRQMNETLEAMAQALFKSWFVDFDPVIDNALAAGNAIPDEFAERAEQRKSIEKKNHSEIQSLFPDEFEFTEEMGWIPKGWAIRNLSEMVSVIIDHRGKTPKKLGGDWAESGYPAISAKNIKGNKLVRPDTIRFVDKDIYDKWMKVPLEVGDVIMTSEAPLGELYYLNSKIDYLLSQRLYAIRADKINCTGSYLFYWFQTEFGSAEIQNRATGTTVFGIKQSELRKVLVLCPPSSVLENFDKYSQGLLGKMDANDLSSTELTKLRDTLLPKLMSGDLKIDIYNILVGCELN